MIEWVVENGYITYQGEVWRQRKGFGMGLQCAPQLANLGCYVVERDFSLKKKPSEVEFNFRYIDDIMTFSGIIPSEEDYGCATR